MALTHRGQYGPHATPKAASHPLLHFFRASAGTEHDRTHGGSAVHGVRGDSGRGRSGNDHRRTRYRAALHGPIARNVTYPAPALHRRRFFAKRDGQHARPERSYRSPATLAGAQGLSTPLRARMWRTPFDQREALTLSKTKFPVARPARAASASHSRTCCALSPGQSGCPGAGQAEETSDREEDQAMPILDGSMSRKLLRSA